MWRVLSFRQLLGGALAALVLAGTPTHWTMVAARGSTGDSALAITSPRSGFATGGNTLEVAVAFTAPVDHAGPLPDTIVLAINGAEAARYTAPAPFSALTHTLSVDLSPYADGPLILSAVGVAHQLVPAPRKGGSTRTRQAVVERANPVLVRLDRDSSNGMVVGPSGGLVTTTDGALSLSIPENALPRATRITVRAMDPSAVPALPGGETPVVAYELLPHGLQFAAPAEVTVTFPGSGKQPDGTIAHGDVALWSFSDQAVEEIDEVQLGIDGNTGRVTARGAITHFSGVSGTLAERIEYEVSGIPTLVLPGQTFTLHVRVTDSVLSTFDGTVLYREVPDFYEGLERVNPTGSSVLIGLLNSSTSETIEADITYRCAEPGTALLSVDLRLQRATPLVAFRAVLFCADEDMDDGDVSATYGETTNRFQVIPTLQVQPLGVAFSFHLHESSTSPFAQFLDIQIIRLSGDDVLSPPVLLSPQSARFSTQGAFSYITDYFTGTADQIIEYRCLRPGTAQLGISMRWWARLPLLVTIVCVAPGNAPPTIDSPAPAQGPIPAGTPFFYHPRATDPNGDTLIWDLLIQPDGMTIDPETGEVEWTPSGSQGGDHPVRIRVRDGNGGEATLDFTLTVESAPPVPLVPVPLVLHRPLSEALSLLAAADFVATITRVENDDFPFDFVFGQDPAAGVLRPRGDSVALIVTPLEMAAFPELVEAAHNSATFGLPPGNRISVAGSNGFVILDALTGEIPFAGSEQLSFLNQGIGPLFGALVFQDPLGTGGDTIFAYGPNGFAQTVFDPLQGRFGAWLLGHGSSTTDASHFGGDPASPGGLFVSFTANEIYPLVPIDIGFARIFFFTRPLVERDAFMGAPGRVVSAFAWDLTFDASGSLAASSTGRVLGVTDGQPGRVYLLNPATPSQPGVDLGPAENGPRQIRCAPLVQLCAISNYDGDSLTIVRWDGRTTASIAGSVPVGDGPVGIGIVADGGNARVISTGFNDGTYTVTTLRGDGSVISTDTRPAPAGCVNPGHAIWLTSTPGSAVLTCKGSGNYVVVTP